MDGGAAGVDGGAPAFPLAPTLAEYFVDPRDAGAVGFALAGLPPATGRSAPILWVQDRMAAMEAGRPSGDGLRACGVDPDRLLLACARRAADVLWTVEEGLRCRSLGAVVAELWGDPGALDFTATKRLAMRAERQGVPVLLMRFCGTPNLSAARTRWRLRSLPSLPDPHDPRAPGAPRWHVELFRARGMKPGSWAVHYDAAHHRLHLATPFRDPALDEAARTAGLAG